MASKANEIHAIVLARCLGSTAPVFSDEQVLLLLRAAIEREGGQAAFAKRYGVDRVYLNMVLSRKRPVGSTIAKALGLREAYVADSMSTDTDR
jgi:DNA-binding phage protein